MKFAVCVLVFVGCVATCQGRITPYRNYRKLRQLESEISVVSDLVDHLRGYVGCYTDDYDRMLNDVTVISDHMTQIQCINYCRDANYKYAGLEYYNQCYCGNNMDLAKYSQMSDNECNTPCKGNPEEMCGGAWHLSIFESPSASFEANTSFIEYVLLEGHVGCYTDDDDRMLKDVTIIRDDMTPNQCIKDCIEANYQYAGLEFYNQCYCGNALDLARYSEMPDNECNTPCKGNPDQMCGGEWHLSIYESLSADFEANTPVVEEVGLEGYLGCYTDDYDRMLNEFHFNSDDMTLNQCINNCSEHNYKFAGLEGYNQCYCGNTMDLTKYSQMSDSDCDTPCKGNPEEMCGGMWRISIYESPSVLFEDYLGCYEDDADRLLNDSVFSSENMTQSQCINHCRNDNFKYAGVEYHDQCYCGNTLDLAKYSKMSDNDCDAPCKGNPEEMCGGGWRISIFEP